jgi:hypothetical protein
MENILLSFKKVHKIRRINMFGAFYAYLASKFRVIFGKNYTVKIL